MKTYINGKIYSWMERINVVTMELLSRLIYRLNTIPIKISVDIFFSEIDKLILKSYGDSRDPQIEKHS